MDHTVTITVDDTVYETLKPFIEQQTVGAFLAKVIETNSASAQKNPAGIAALRGSLHHVDTSNTREENERVV